MLDNFISSVVIMRFSLRSIGESNRDNYIAEVVAAYLLISL